jgi:3-hydroxyisobutyrate dehydrogenase-like beta-hydroxyacid dehydrogenase
VKLKVGIIGFGGAAYGLVKGLKTEGPVEINFFDTHLDDPSLGKVIRERSAEMGANPVADLDRLAETSEVIISCVTGTVAVDVAETAARTLGPQHLYVDVNTASPTTMQAVAAALKKSGTPGVDVAMMGAIPAFMHRVPCLASGNGAKRFQTLMKPYNMDITCVGDSFGQASAIKMFRSIFMKGFLALLIEMLRATHQYEVDAIVLDSLRKTMEQNNFLETVRLQMAKGVINAERMAHEMEAVMQTLAEMGLPSEMTLATKEKLDWCSQMALAEHFGHKMPATLEEILTALDYQASQL